MSDKSRELALRFLKKADHDLITARQTLLLPDGPTDTVCFHAQQAIEKALKAWLTFLRVPFPRTHDLIELLDLALPRLPEMERYRERFAELTEYAVEMRYPDDSFEPPRDEALSALSFADEMVSRIRRELSKASSEKE